MNITNEVLANKIDNIAAQMTDMKLTMATFVPSNVFALEIKDLQNTASNNKTAINETNARMDSFLRHRTIQVWITGTLSAAAGILLALLVEFYLSNVGRK